MGKGGEFAASPFPLPLFLSFFARESDLLPVSFSATFELRPKVQRLSPLPPRLTPEFNCSAGNDAACSTITAGARRERARNFHPNYTHTHSSSVGGAELINELVDDISTYPLD